MEISMCTDGTGISMMDLDDFINYYSSCMNGLINSKNFRIIASPNQLMVDDIAEIKVFPGHRSMMVTIKTTDGEAKQVKAVCSSEDTYDLRKGVFIALAKYIAPDDSMTPEGYEFLAKCMTYYKDWSKLVDKAIRQYEKSCKEAEKKAKIQQEEKEKAVERWAKNFAKVQAKKKAKKDEFVRAVADAIRISSEKKEESSENEGEKEDHTIKKDRYEIGDRVLIKQWNDMVAEYGVYKSGNIKTELSFTPGMREYCGNIMTVSLVDEDGVYKLKDAGFWFSNDMIEGAVQE